MCSVHSVARRGAQRGVRPKSWQIADMNGFLLKQAKDVVVQNFSKGLTYVLPNHTISPFFCQKPAISCARAPILTFFIFFPRHWV